MKIASVAEVKSQFSAYLKASEGGPIVVTRNGRPVAVIVGVQDEDEIERLLMAYSPHLRAILDRSRQQFREGKWLSEEEFWSQFEPAQPSEGAATPKKKRGRGKGKGMEKRSEADPTPVGRRRDLRSGLLHDHGGALRVRPRASPGSWRVRARRARN